jgi:2,4-dienoyl-CoA reductase-like NADH-dependent reductase (Old Yellow Enzyme family)
MMATAAGLATDITTLFAPLQINGLTVENRIVMAPMTRYFSPGGVPGPDVADYYARRAAGGVGLIVTEGTLVGHPSVTAPEGVPHFHGDKALAGWADVVAAVHRAGGRIVPQLWHTGIYRDTGFVPEAHRQVGPSGLALTGERVTDPMREPDVDEAIDAHVRAAVDAKAIGFDGIELHGAHGFLLDQFLWTGTNRRTDRYGGSPSRRARFAAEVVRVCRQAVGPDFPIIFRFSQWKVTDYTARIAESPDELAGLLQPLVWAGVDAFHVSARRFWLPAFAGWNLSLASWTKAITGKPVIAVGSVGLEDSDFQEAFAGRSTPPASLERVVDAIRRDDFDLVAVGRALLSDPSWAAKIRDGRLDELAPFDPESLEKLA